MENYGFATIVYYGKLWKTKKGKGIVYELEMSSEVG